LNNIGTGIMVIPAILAALILWGIVPVEVPVTILFVVVAICGTFGGVVNILGRGPVAAGAVIGLVTGLGGFGAVYFWINGRESVFWLEITIAFLIGIVPGFLLQFAIQRVLAKRAAGED
jgi:hypothetical protein